MATGDPCLAAIDKFWETSRKGKDYPACAESLRLWLKYLTVSGKIPVEYNKSARKRIAFLEETLKSLEFQTAAKVIDAIKYARNRIDTSSEGPARGGKFKSSVTDTERNRVARALDTGFLANLKRPTVAYSDPSNRDDEFGGDDRSPVLPRLE
jgi:hypothetical protein